MAKITHVDDYLQNSDTGIEIRHSNANINNIRVLDEHPPRMANNSSINQIEASPIIAQRMSLNETSNDNLESSSPFMDEDYTYESRENQ